MLDPHNLWVYNATNAATSELPTGASSSGYKPEANQSVTVNTLKVAANTTATNSYVSDTTINDKLKDIEVQLTADGNITVTSNVTIVGTSSSKFTIVAAKKDNDPATGHVVIRNASINVSAGVTVGAQGNITVHNSNLTSKNALTIGSSNREGIVHISNSNLSGAATTVMAIQGNVDITGGRVNGTTSVRIAASSTNGNATLSGVSVNTPDVTVGGSNITLDNATLNVTPNGADKGINIGGGRTPAKNVVIKNSNLNTTGSTAGVINI